MNRDEIVQSMRHTVLTKHPQTGEPVRRLIVGGTELSVRAATIEWPEPRPPKKPRWKKDGASSRRGPRTHYDHGDDHDH